MSSEVPAGVKILSFETLANEDESFIYALAPADGYFVVNNHRHLPVRKGMRIVVAKSAFVYFERANLR